MDGSMAKRPRLAAADGGDCESRQQERELNYGTSIGETAGHVNGGIHETHNVAPPQQPDPAPVLREWSIEGSRAAGDGFPPHHKSAAVSHSTGAVQVCGH